MSDLKIGNMAMCDGTYDCIADFHRRDCRVKQRIVDELKTQRFNEVLDSASERHKLKELVWKIYQDREKVLLATKALEAILNPPTPDPCYCDSAETCNCGDK